jgi:hypothetical protein
VRLYSGHHSAAEIVLTGTMLIRHHESAKGRSQVGEEVRHAGESISGPRPGLAFLVDSALDTSQAANDIYLLRGNMHLLSGVKVNDLSVNVSEIAWGNQRF